ncbi:hypothetical protein Microterr_09870 [Microbacterium terricola]|uniref:Uncharacterized protein n=1 Tax=Microbacterium terricola TaxID=344163 RepID=A0ABM8DXG7_9MICO|nr:hypothetical protein Microterr_09870 [Microbacterium terricola]
MSEDTSPYQRLTVMAECDTFPVWDRNPANETFGPADPASLQVSDELVEALSEWAERYNERAPSDEDERTR